MKQALITLVILAAGAGVAAAQEDPDRAMEDLRKKFEKSMKDLREKFEAERGRLEKDFKAAREKLLPRVEEKVEKKFKEGSKSVEELLARLLERVEDLERRFDRDLPKFRRFEFDFKDDRWRDLLPRLREKFEKKEKKRDEGF